MTGEIENNCYAKVGVGGGGGETNGEKEEECSRYRYFNILTW